MPWKVALERCIGKVPWKSALERFLGRMPWKGAAVVGVVIAMVVFMSIVVGAVGIVFVLGRPGQ